jgi:lambda repressor-like predicted transcriptional regulator
MARLSKAKLAERREAEWELYACRGWTMPQIARHYGLETSTISDDLRIYREALPPQTREQMIDRHHAKLAEINQRLDEIAQLPAPPVTAGAQGNLVFDPETGEIVRDYAARVAALREQRTTLAQEAKLAGLNAADKVEVTGSVTFEGSVDAELQELANQLGLQGPVLPARYAADGLSEGVGSDAPTA